MAAKFERVGDILIGLLTTTGKCFPSGLVFLVIVFSFLAPSRALAHRPVIVSLPNDPYLAFEDDKGNPSGLFVDVIEKIAEKEQWNIRYVPCAMAECIEGLERGEIDIGLAIEPSEANEMKLHFSSVPVFNNWAYVYGLQGSGIESIRDLDGVHVAIARDDPHLKYLYSMAEGSAVRVHVVEVPGYLDVIGILEEGVVTAGVIDRANGLFIDETYGSLVRTPVMLNPVRVYFSARKGHNADLLSAIDRHMAEMKQDKGSAYYSSLDRWFIHHEGRWEIWMTIAILAAICVITFLIQRNRKLHKRAAKAEADKALKLPYDPLQSYSILFSSSKNFMALVDRDLVYRDVNDMYMQAFRLDRHEIVGRPVRDIVGAEVFEGIIEEYFIRCLNGQEVNFEYWLDLPVKGKTCLNASLYPYPHSAGRVEGVICSSYEVTKQKQAEKERDLKEYRLSALYELGKKVYANESELATFALEQAIGLTGSSIGYIGRMNDNEDIMTVYSWSRDVMKVCDVQDRTLDFPIKGSGLWAEAIRQRRAIIINDYKALNHLKKGLPEGHVDLKSFLSVPIFEGGRIAMVMAVGNKEEAYDASDVRQLAMMMEGVWLHMRRRRSDDALRESEERYRALFERASSPIMIVDEQGCYIGANDAALSFLECDAETLLGRSVFDHAVPGSVEKVECEHRPLWEGGGVIETNYLVNGKVKTLDLTITSMRLAGKRVILGIGRDITENKRAEEGLRKLSNIFEHADWGIAVWSVDNRTFEMMNPAFAGMHGYTVEELTGQPIISVLAPECRDEVPGHILVANEKGRHSFESMHIRKDGTVFPVSMDVTAVKDDEGNVLYRAVSVQDITVRKEAEKALMERWEVFTKTFQKSPCLMSISEIETGRLLDVNEKFVEVTGYVREKAIGRTSIEIGWISAEDREILKREIATKGRATGLDFDLRKSDGSIVTCMVSAEVITVDGKARLLTTGVDITVRKKAEESMRFMVESTTGIVGQDFFEEMVESTCTWLGCEVGLIAEVFDGKSARSLAMRVDGKNVENYQYDLKGTPCENVVSKGFCHFIDNIAEMFPEDSDLKEMGLSGYVGIPLRNSKGDTVGILCAMSRSTMDLPVRAGEVISILAARCGAEIERKNTEQALRESEETARVLLNATYNSTTLLSPDGMVLDVNETTAKRFGKSPGEIIGTSIWDYFPPEVARRRRVSFDEVVRTGRQLTFVDEREGIWNNNYISPVLNAEGRVLKVAVLAHDITELKRTELALRESEETARALMNSPTDAALIIDADGMFYAVNDTAAKRLNKSAEEIIGTDAFDFLPPEVRKQRREAFNKVIRTGKALRFIDNRAGRWLDNVLYPVLNPEGRTVRVAVVSRDITEQKTIEKDREDLLHELQDALDSVKTLSGLLPVCPSCRSIKDGEGYWSNLEAYLSKHSDAEVAPSLCPECVAGIYPDSQSTDMKITPLSKREKEVLSWIKLGKSTWDISQILGISENTVKYHVSSILRKLNVSTRSQAVAISMELRLLDDRTAN